VQYNLSTPLKIVGDGPLRQLLEKKVQQAGYGNLIEFLGYQDKSVVMALMNNAKVLVFPSIWYEGFPLTIIEAFAASLPVLVPKLGSMAEIVEEQVTGLHFEAGNVQDLVDKIDWLVNHPEMIDILGNNARFIYESKYTSQANYQQLMNIYQSVMQNFNLSSNPI
jgi:glycosyltransferase involved in cell wall biosynthesis